MNLHDPNVQQWIPDVQAYIDELCNNQQEQKLEVPLFFIRFLHQMLHSCSISAERAQVYGVATTLLKMGLDTHTQAHHEPMDVLAGDYLSIQFYCLLAEQGEVDGIGHIAKTISKINELNMEHHVWVQQGVPYDEIALQRVQHIASALILAVANFFCESGLEMGNWRELIPRVFLINEVCSTSYQLTPSGEKFIEHTMIELQEILSSFKTRQIQEELQSLLTEHHIYLVKAGENYESVLC